MALLASTAAAGSALAQSTWIGSNPDEDFSNGGNWDTNPVPPGAGDTAIISTGVPEVVNNYTVDTLTVNGGNLTITATGELNVLNGATLSSAGSITVQVGGALNSDINQSNGTITIGGDMNGVLTKSNGAVVVNTGGTLDELTQTGGTATNGGTIDNANINGGTVSNTGTVTSLTQTAGTFNNNAGGTVTGIVSVSGGTLNNAGTITNTGSVSSLNQTAGTFNNNAGGTISGTTTISGGTVTNAGTVGAVTNSAGATFTNSATAGAVTNSGTVNNTGTIASLSQSAGTFNNNAGGTISGTTTIAGGTVTNAGTVGAVTNSGGGTFTNSATAGAVTNSGTVNNTGTIASLSQSAGTFNNNAGGTISGTTTISGGTVTNTGTVGAVTNSAGATFTNSGTAGAVTNSGTVTNTGTIASLTQSGGSFTNNVGGSITGAVTMNAGRLVNNGSLLGTIEVANASVLKGTGSFGTINIASGGTIAPGNSIGTMRSTGNLVFASGAFYEVEVDASGNSDRIDVSGTTTINGGTVTVIAETGSYASSTDYRILSSTGGISGQFNSVTSNLAFLAPNLVYGTNTITLTLKRNAVSFSSVGITRNQRNVGAAMDRQARGAIYDGLLSLSATGARVAFDALSGDIYPSVASVTIQQGDRIRDALNERMAADDDNGFWSDAYGTWGHNALVGSGASPVHFGSGGLQVGADAEAFDNTRFGAAAGYARTNMWASNHTAEAMVNTYEAALYAAFDLGGLGLRSGVSYAHHDVEVDRTVRFGGFSDQLAGRFGAATAQIFTEIGYEIGVGDIKLEPIANIAWIDYRSDALVESGGAARLSVSAMHKQTGVSLLGLRFGTEGSFDQIPIRLSGMLGWRHTFGDATPVAGMSFAGGTTFDIGGVPVARDAGVAQIAAGFALTPTATLDFLWRGSYAVKQVSNQASLRLGIAF